MTKQDDTRNTKLVIWFNSLLRWGLGLLFMAFGYSIYATNNAGAWVLLFFGLAFFVTGFFRPKRCLNDSCDV